MATATHTQIDLTTKDLAALLGCTPRMVNIYRESVEQRTGRSIGYKLGRTTHFRPEEQDAIRSERERGVNPQEVSAKAQQRSNANYSSTVNQAEETMQQGMGDIVAQSDAQAIAMGQMLGQRFNSLMMGSMMQVMSQGFADMQTGMGELTASLQCSVPTAPSLAPTGGASRPLALGDGTPNYAASGTDNYTAADWQ
jgi:hypothetical protein